MIIPGILKSLWSIISRNETILNGAFHSNLIHALFFLNKWVTDSEEMVGEETDFKI